jgi:hypothetical protein
MASVRLTLSQANIGALLGDSPTSPVVREVAEIGRDLERTCKRLCPVSKEGNRLDGVYAGQLADAIDIRITTGRVPRAVVSIDAARAPYWKYVVHGAGPAAPDGKYFADFLHGGAIRRRVSFVQGHLPNNFMQEALAEVIARNQH